MDFTFFSPKHVRICTPKPSSASSEQEQLYPNSPAPPSLKIPQHSTYSRRGMQIRVGLELGCSLSIVPRSRSITYSIAKHEFFTGSSFTQRFFRHWSFSKPSPKPLSGQLWSLGGFTPKWCCTLRLGQIALMSAQSCQIVTLDLCMSVAADFATKWNSLESPPNSDPHPHLPPR